jgi:hypothetical protein
VADPELPPWVAQLLDDEGPVTLPGDERSVFARFHQGIEHLQVTEPERRRLRRAVLMAVEGRLDDGGENG